MSVRHNVNIKPTSEFQLPLPSSLTGPVILSHNYEDAVDQLHYLLQAKLITHNTIFFQYTERDPADEWIYEIENDRNYRSYFEDWVWAEGDIRECRKDDIFRLRRLFGEDEDENEEETDERDRRNQKEGDTSVYWLLDFSRHILDVRQNLPLDRHILKKLNWEDKAYIIIPYPTPKIRTSWHRRHA
ncbi:uncharacterized protein LOC117167759 [Belonocnema kinseyi]|uniref:uncharacterized protein LOC117167759 n=1 Tax=Belonocnema kinseyi TaxID=2817044 RepID=UPI00143E051F|nr:uncharacterized protein LOC117167759 [Belonocnema kinseyi]XP_033208816.1 uncharacterized protein LOC117167759 [Belonocnema kinseyi]